jgi:hypothetical protein
MATSRMKTRALKLVRELFAVDYVPLHTQRHNQRQWVKSVRQLGDRWLLAKPLDLPKKH